MKKIFKELFTQADDKVHLKYLLAKNDIDDIKAALLIISQNIKARLPNFNISILDEKLYMCCETETHVTVIMIRFIEELLVIQYNGCEAHEMFHYKSGSDIELLTQIKMILKLLGFRKTDQLEMQKHGMHLIYESYRIDNDINNLEENKSLGEYSGYPAAIR